MPKGTYVIEKDDYQYIYYIDTPTTSWVEIVKNGKHEKNVTIVPEKFDGVVEALKKMLK